MTKGIEYVATLPHVREVTLLGSADLGFWTDHLRTEDLTPLDDGGRAQLLVIAADSHFMGLSFQEVSFSVLLAPRGAFLVQAFNSRRFFAFCERTFFRTPYDFAHIRASAAQPSSIQLTRKEDLLFRAEVGVGAAPEEAASSPLRQGWSGPIHLPSRGRAHRRFFVAQIGGDAQIIAFDPARDALDIRPAGGPPLLQALIDSRFEPRQWIVRPDAKHAKSKTYRTSEIATMLGDA